MDGNKLLDKIEKDLVRRTEMINQYDEIIDLHFDQSGSLENQPQVRILILASIPFYYAQLEGFIKLTAKEYYHFVLKQGYSPEMLNVDLVVTYFALATQNLDQIHLDSFEGFGGTEKIKPLIELLLKQNQLTLKDYEIDFKFEKNSRKNINFRLLENNIFKNIGLNSSQDDVKNYIEKFKLYDSFFNELLRVRNTIAHQGNYNVAHEYYIQIRDRIQEIMKLYCDIIKFAVDKKLYLRN